MNKIRFSALLLAALSGSLFAQTLVTVNGEAIDSSVIDSQVKIMAANQQVRDSAELRQYLTEDQVVRTAVAQEAKRLKLDQSAEYRKALETARAEAKKSGADKQAGFKTEWAVFESELLGQAYAAYIAAQAPVAEADVKAAYQQFADHYKGSDEVLLGEIVTKTQAEAQKAVAELKAKKGFADVFKRYSLDEQRKQSQELFVPVPLKDLQQSAPPVYAAVKDLKKGGVSAPVAAGQVFSVFYVNDRRALQVPTYEQLKGEIAQSLQAQRIDQAVGSLLQKAKIQPAK
ncbi:peptidylprolyl isomerase [Neisseria lisongii]|uniref:peptidylprolyl isomerase n=1 Tax=Neisseria lisongii TaxID=2912188 RepID=A0AAW5ALW7_9NEIS|nr:peptidyl-prolyl cis-trans isomerase [Neisseria lisongii]MCF7529097.1 peptidyl-prolyl cis-trans isomerase [Neisseria lisongii]